MSLDVVIFRPSWQVMRVSCLKENNPYGGFLTAEGSADALNRLENYINNTDSVTDTENVRMKLTQEEETACRVYRVEGFLAATINGLVNQHLPHIVDVDEYKNSLIPRLDHHLVTMAANKWNWDVVRFELEDLWIKERSWFTAILTDMKERIVEKDNKSGSIQTFYNLLLQVNS